MFLVLLCLFFVRLLSRLPLSFVPPRSYLGLPAPVPHLSLCLSSPARLTSPLLSLCLPAPPPALLFNSSSRAYLPPPFFSSPLLFYRSSFRLLSVCCCVVFSVSRRSSLRCPSSVVLPLVHDFRASPCLSCVAFSRSLHCLLLFCARLCIFI